MSDPGSVAFENGSAADSTQADDSKDRSDLAFTGHGPPTQNEATVNFCPSNGISSDEVTTVQEMSEEGAVMRVVRGSGQLNMEGNEFHVGNQVNVTHAHGELHQHVGTMVKKQIIQTNNFTCSDDIPGYDQIKDQSRMDMASGDNVFVETKGFHQALGLLKKHGVLVIQGPSGSGKSAIGYALLRHFDNLGYTPLILHRVQEWRSHIGGDRKQVVLLDGVFGEVCLDFESISKWSKTFNNMLEYAKSHKCLILLTVYAHITSEICASAHVGDFFQRVEILRLDLLPEFSKHEKREMARKYLTANAEAVTEQVMNEILTVKQCGPTFPWLLNEYFRFPAGSAQRSTILKAPERAHLPFLRKLLADKAMDHCFAAVLLLAMRTNSDFHCSLENLRQQLNEIGLPGIGAKAVQTAARHFTGNYIVKDRSCFTSRTTYNAAGLALGASEFLPNLLQVCDLEFLIQYVHTEDSHMEALKVDCKSSGYETFLERIYMEIVRGNIQEVCQIQSLQSKELLQNFKHFCENHKDFRKMLAAKDTKHKQTILYWSSFCPSTQLTDWVISEKSERLNQQNQQLTTELQQILFVYALSGKNTSCEIVKSVITAWKKNIRRPYLLDHLKLPLPSKKQRITEELQEVCHTMYTRTLPDTVCYLEDSSLVVPRELFSLRTFKNKISLNMPGKHWYLAFRLLADREADEKDAEGNTLLHLAADIGDIDDIKLAIKSGASLTAENTQSLTPPELARKRRKRAADGNPWRTTVFKKHMWARHAPLRAACENQHKEIVELLLQRGASVNERYEEKRTPLHIACAANSCDIVLVLVNHGADVHAVDDGGRTSPARGHRE
ncbi:hypothetical protein BaRGS_00021480 [Batillaria attramentaria]|uniref:Novel STAND NTPase 3 domain-containing protein n=1 Tax=Batillaria attramentaria TaxID=370345 RepID=A0ABD0KJP8_9CAEN